MKKTKVLLGVLMLAAMLVNIPNVKGFATEKDQTAFTTEAIYDVMEAEAKKADTPDQKNKENDSKPESAKTKSAKTESAKPESAKTVKETAKIEKENIKAAKENSKTGKENHKTIKEKASDEKKKNAVKKSAEELNFKEQGPKEDIADSKERAVNTSYSKSDLRYLSAIIFCEAGGHSYKGKLAVANTIVNRRNDKSLFGHVSTIKDVIYDRKWAVQFTPAYSSSNSLNAALKIYDNLENYKGTWRYDYMMSAKKAAKEVLSGKTVLPKKYYYFNSHISASKAKCKSKGASYQIIGSHIYF